MNYELSQLEELLTKKRTNDRNKLIEKETKRVKDAFMAELFSDKSEPVMKRYVQFHQKTLLSFADNLSGKTYHSKKIENNGQPQDSELVVHVDELLIFLEKHFREYIQLDCSVPKILREKSINDIALKLDSVERKLKALSIDSRLTNLILQPLNEFIEEENKITYRRMYFTREMVDGLLSLPEKKKFSDFPKAVIEVLCQANLNCITFYYYCKDEITKIITGKESLIDQIYALTRLQNYFLKLQSKPGLSYISKRLSITTMLSDWLHDLITKKQKELEIQIAEMHGSLDPDGQKVITNFTIQELGLVIRLFIDADAFRTKNKKALARFMAKNVVTHQKSLEEEFSVDHIYGAIYTTNPQTLDSIEAMMNRMNGILKKMREDLLNKKNKSNK